MWNGNGVAAGSDTAWQIPAHSSAKGSVHSPAEDAAESWNNSKSAELAPTSSATDAKSRLQHDLSRQRGADAGLEKPLNDDDLITNKERLRRLRVGQKAGLSTAERLRRLRISAANKGKVPWNIGRRHSEGELSSKISFWVTTLTDAASLLQDPCDWHNCKIFHSCYSRFTREKAYH